MPKINPCISLPETAKVKIRQNLEISFCKMLEACSEFVSSVGSGEMELYSQWQYQHHDSYGRVQTWYEEEKKGCGNRWDFFCGFSVGHLLSSLVRALILLSYLELFNAHSFQNKICLKLYSIELKDIPWLPEVFFPVVCRKKLSGDGVIVTSSSRSRLRRSVFAANNRKKKRLAPRATHNN